MDKKVYEKTRYQNIYRNKINKNYIIVMSTPVKTSISKYNNQKIYDINDAKKVRDSILIKEQKAVEVKNKETFDTIWENYIYDCKYVKKLAYNTLNRKNKTYNKYLKNRINIPLSKTTKEYWAKFIDDFECSNKQKNELLKQLRALFNWCIDNDKLINNPILKISNYKETKEEMKYWLPDELKTFLTTLENDINYSNNRLVKEKAYLIKILTITNFSLGDRIGETRALTFNCINKENKTIIIKHSINYDTKSTNYFSTTKTPKSQRINEITDKLIQEIEDYKNFLINECNYKVNDDSLIIFNYKNNKPYSDATLRKHFKYYCNKANVKIIRMYDLRHTYVATMMAEGKPLYYISPKIGHNNYITTVKKYGHISDEVKRKLAESTDKYI